MQCTLQYRPPESLLRLGSYTGAMDVWSLGMVLLELFLGETLVALSECDMLSNITSICGPPPRGRPCSCFSVGLSHWWRSEIIKACAMPRLAAYFVYVREGGRDGWVPRQEALDRRSLDELVRGSRHWREDSLPCLALLEVLRATLVWDPARRPSAAELLRAPLWQALRSRDPEAPQPLSYTCFPSASVSLPDLSRSFPPLPGSDTVVVVRSPRDSKRRRRASSAPAAMAVAPSLETRRLDTPRPSAGEEDVMVDTDTLMPAAGPLLPEALCAF